MIIPYFESQHKGQQKNYSKLDSPSPRFRDNIHQPANHHGTVVMDSLPGKAWDFPGFPRASKSRSMALRSTTLVSPKGSASGTMGHGNLSI